MSNTISKSLPLLVFSSISCRYMPKSNGIFIASLTSSKLKIPTMMFLNHQIYSLKFKLKSTSNGPNFYFELFEDRTKSELKLTRFD